MTNQQRSAYRRIVVGLCHDEDNAQIVRSAAELAQLMGLHLHCRFIEDEALLALAGLPFAREIRLPTHAWSPLTVEAVEADIRQAAIVTRQTLDKVMQELKVPTEFAVSRGDPAECLAAICQTDDIVVISERAAITVPSTHSRQRLGAVAHDQTRSILLLPADPRSTDGPLVAMLTRLSDLVLDIAINFAVNAKLDLLVLAPEWVGAEVSSGAQARAQSMGLPQQRVTVRTTRSARMEDRMGALADVQERMIIASRDEMTADQALGVTMDRRSPVLLVMSARPTDR